MRRASATVHAITTIQPVALQPGSPKETWLACTSQYEGKPSATTCMKPCSATGNHVPLTRASSDTIPPVAGPIESTVMRWPSRIPRAANGASPMSMSAVICAHSPTGRLTPVKSPHANNSAIEHAAIA